MSPANPRMPIRPVFALLAGLVVLLPLGPADKAEAGWRPASDKAVRAKTFRARKARPYVVPSSPRYPGGRCGQLNLERARLYGLCR